MDQSAFFTLSLAIAVAAISAFVVFSGKLLPTMQRGVEWVLWVAVAAVLIADLGWGLAAAFYGIGWDFGLAVQPIILAWIVTHVVSERRRKARDQSRQPGTFG